MPLAVGNRQLLEQPTSFISVRPLKDVGNGLCAVPLRGNYNLCKQTGTTPDMSFRANSESRNLPEWQVLSCVGTFLPRGGFLHSAYATVGMT